VKRFIKANGIDVLMIDPLVSFHAVAENDNMAMDFVVKSCFGRRQQKRRTT
jgi:hypothetical protein